MKYQPPPEHPIVKIDCEGGCGKFVAIPYPLSFKVLNKDGTFKDGFSPLTCQKCKDYINTEANVEWCKLLLQKHQHKLKGKDDV